jgi:PBP1b-binding outer membrane lipoprotein LpoB
MTRLLVLASAAICALFASGCATPGSPSRAEIVTDDQKVAAIEHAARRTGVLVKWVNPPTKRVTPQAR